MAFAPSTPLSFRSVRAPPLCKSLAVCRHASMSATTSWVISKTTEDGRAGLHMDKYARMSKGGPAFSETSGVETPDAAADLSADEIAANAAAAAVAAIPRAGVHLQRYGAMAMATGGALAVDSGSTNSPQAPLATGPKAAFPRQLRVFFSNLVILAIGTLLVCLAVANYGRA